jgi:hypothetical protein
MLVCLAVLLAALPTRGQLGRHWSWGLLQSWLKAEHEKVVKDSDRVVVLARSLRHEVEQNTRVKLPETIPERARELEAKAKQLRETVGDVDENFLSVRVVTLAAEVRDQARSLRETFERQPGRDKLERMRGIAQEIERRADAVRKRASAP